MAESVQYFQINRWTGHCSQKGFCNENRDNVSLVILILVYPCSFYIEGLVLRRRY